VDHILPYIRGGVYSVPFDEECYSWLYAMVVLKTLCQVPGQEPDTNKP